MFTRGTYIKMFLIISLVMVMYGHFQALRRNSQLAHIQAELDKPAIIAMLGEPDDIFNCNASANLPPLLNKDNLCKGNAYEVYAFPRCYLSTVCPGNNYVAFDQAGRPVSSYAWVAPLFPGGPEL